MNTYYANEINLESIRKYVNRDYAYRLSENLYLKILVDTTDINFLDGTGTLVHEDGQILSSSYKYNSKYPNTIFLIEASFSPKYFK